jgi:hypothetical protein
MREELWRAWNEACWAMEEQEHGEALPASAIKANTDHFRQMFEVWWGKNRWRYV